EQDFVRILTEPKNSLIKQYTALLSTESVTLHFSEGAVAAMAYGAGSVPRCAAVVGPGNKWVLEAKRQVAGEVVIDSPAGPSEVLVLADATADPARVAAELVAQAEHDPDAAVALVSTSSELLRAAEVELAVQVARAPRREVIEEALVSRGAFLLAATRAEAIAFTDAYAAEHLALFTTDPHSDLAGIRTAGTVFMGGASAVAFGDYLTGANHVLPTAGTSRSYSGLSVLHYLRSYTWQELTDEGAASLADDTVRLAEAEGLPGHAAAAAMRRTRAASDGSDTGSAV
ncbi:MAG: histidinol dehydrogenase, partial [Longimicrobiales bacterium]|nr:histidinol dehydrogenase [Longimicrobiales bacterium]